MKLLVRPSLLRGEIAVTGSKSHTIRGIAAALAANGTSVLVAPARVGRHALDPRGRQVAWREGP